MKRILSTVINTGAVNFWLLIVRVAVGALMLTHGMPKLQTLLAGGHIEFADPFHIGATASLALAIFAELFCSILLILGLATRLAMIPLIITMLVAIFYALAPLPFAKKELAVMYLLIYIGFFILGAGKYSVDNLIGGKGKRR